MELIRKGKIRTGIIWEYDGDGRFPNDRWNKDEKKYWKRWRRRNEKDELIHFTEAIRLDEELDLKSSAV